jgi:hypothetical protein
MTQIVRSWGNEEKKHNHLKQIYYRGVSMESNRVRHFDTDRHLFINQNPWKPQLNTTPLDFHRHQEKSKALKSTFCKYKQYYATVVRMILERKAHKSHIMANIDELNRIADVELIPLMKDVIEIVNPTLKDEFKIHEEFDWRSSVKSPWVLVPKRHR